MKEVVTVPNNFVTVFHSLTADLGIGTPWPKPSGYVPEYADQAILVWGGGSSVGQFAIQILKFYGYTNILTTASARHHDKLRSYGAKHMLDYNSVSVIKDILNVSGSEGVKKVLDCIGSKDRSIAPIAKIAKNGARVAVMLPVIVRNSSEEHEPIYSMEVGEEATWEKGVEPRGVRTHFYLEVSWVFFFRTQVKT